MQHDREIPDYEILQVSYKPFPKEGSFAFVVNINNK